MWRIIYKGLTLEEFLIMANMNILEASCRQVSPLPLKVAARELIEPMTEGLPA